MYPEEKKLRNWKTWHILERVSFDFLTFVPFAFQTCSKATNWNATPEHFQMLLQKNWSSERLLFQKTCWRRKFFVVFRLVNFYNFFIATRKPVLSLLQPSFYLPPAPISFVESAAYCLNLLRFATSGVVLQPLRPSLLSSELAFAPWGAQDQLPLLHPGPHSFFFWVFFLLLAFILLSPFLRLSFLLRRILLTLQGTTGQSVRKHHCCCLKPRFWGPICMHPCRRAKKANTRYIHKCKHMHIYI